MILSVDPFALDLKVGGAAAHRLSFLTSTVLNEILCSMYRASRAMKTNVWHMGCDRIPGNEVPWRGPDSLLNMAKTPSCLEVEEPGILTRWPARRRLQIKDPDVCL